MLQSDLRKPVVPMNRHGVSFFLYCLAFVFKLPTKGEKLSNWC